jgi:hypothetical protein
MPWHIQPSDLFDDLSGQFSDVAVSNDGPTVGEDPLAFGPGSMQGRLPLFFKRKTLCAKGMSIGFRRHAEPVGNRKSFCDQAR